MTSNDVGIVNISEEKERNRALFYKKPIKRDNYKLEPEHEETPQEIRRKRLLHHQKECRNTALNAGRAILDDVSLSGDENEEPMEVDKHKNKSKKYKAYANKLMMSEWMMDVPEDFIDNWSMVPCPKGRRNLIVAHKGRTKAYSRRGEKIIEFNSALPGGNNEEMNRFFTLLDCIWVAKQKVYYVLDVLAWSTQPLLNCDAEFRRFWLNSKLEEMPDLKLEKTRKNQYPILPLPNVPCSENLSEFIANLSTFPSIDGLLFYHKDGFYMHGFTPLVTWLKSYMLPEVLGISVPSPLDEKPLGYIDFRHYISSGKTRNKEPSSSPDFSMETNTDI